MAKVKGDPRSNFVDALRLWLYLDFVCEEAGIKKTGYQLGHNHGHPPQGGTTINSGRTSWTPTGT